ncbi:copper resistance protein NlpE [Algoriphagus litoralis]|uniref:copper resistance protein NlpE n=1 Tax=Algoriphagus litoralis TaxID=2202829 RepID=UPI000DBA56D4|nr:copper resistance protein NlpE [Algoriphagus litoralis]
MKKSLFLILALAAFQFGCNKATETGTESAEINSDTTETAQAPRTGDNSQTSLDWPGTYFNTLPCASCEGIETWVTLNQDGTFELKTNYLGLNDAREETFTGKFTWDPTGSMVQLEGLIGDAPGKYKVGENQIWHLDQEGNRIEGSLAEFYILKKQ